MKKIFIIVTIITMAFTVGACSKINSDKDGNIGNKQTLEENVEKQYIYGRVKNITGNEIELEVAKDPEVEIAGIDKEEKGNEEKDKGKTEAALTTGAMPVGESDKVSVGDIDKNKPLIDLEFTEKEKSILIPTGIDINILSAASGKGLSAIKEGTYLRILVDDTRVENPNILAVDVIS